jgi:hypothetical protein
LGGKALRKTDPIVNSESLEKTYFSVFRSDASRTVRGSYYLSATQYVTGNSRRHCIGYMSHVYLGLRIVRNLEIP